MLQQSSTSELKHPLHDFVKHEPVMSATPMGRGVMQMHRIADA